MSALDAGLRAILGSLVARNVGVALVGGLAVSIRAHPRFTRDIDLVVAVSDDMAAERLVLELRVAKFAIHAVVEHETAHRLATVRLSSGNPPVVTDLLFASSGIEAEIVAEADAIKVFPNIECKVARVGHLIVLKALARDDERRPQDAMDLKALAAVLDDVERARARHAADLVVRRGYGRGRDLRALVDAFLNGPPP